MIKWFLSRGSTEKLYIINLIMAWLFLWSCFLLTMFSGQLNITDMSICIYGIPAMFAEVGVFSGFFVWKNKNENISKFGNNLED